MDANAGTPITGHSHATAARKATDPNLGGPPDSAAPPGHGQPLDNRTTRIFLAATAITLISGMILFGWSGARVLGLSVISAIVIDGLFIVAERRAPTSISGRTLLIGALFACTLPPQVSWEVPVIGAAMAVAIGRLLGGPGSQLWHSVVVGRLGTQILFHDDLTPSTWPVLAPGRLLLGSLDRAAPLAPAADWRTHAAPKGVDAWSSSRPVDVLQSSIPTDNDQGTADALAMLIRDSLPPWQDTLTGVAGGTLGGACALALMAGGLMLVYFRLLRWSMLLAGLGAALLAAAILPIRIQGDTGSPAFAWLPGFAVYEGLPVGAVYLLHHLTAGDFLLVLTLLAPNPGTSPLTTRGRLCFGAVFGLTTIALRNLLMLPAAGYWALLLANTLVPLINRMTRRRPPTT